MVKGTQISTSMPAFSISSFSARQGDQGRMPVVGDHPDGMGLEGHGNGRAIHGIGHFDHLVKKGLVAEVHTVEIADGDHGRFEGFFYGFDILYYFHDLSANRKKWALTLTMQKSAGSRSKAARVKP
jgi:hypothetical protein